MQVSDKETRAVFLNFKEMRCLEKNVQNLNLEEAYSVSLINLEQKVMKARDKKMRDRVSKIKSHLSQSDIEEMRKLEEQGKLKVAESSSKLDSNLRIAAAEKRLKLIGRAKSAVPRLEGSKSRTSSRMATARTPRTPLPSNRNKTPIPAIVAPEDALPNFPVPRSVRAERRNSISIQDVDTKSIKIKVPKIAFVDTSDSESGRSPQESPRTKDARRQSRATPIGGQDKFYLQLPEGASPSTVSPSTPLTPKSPSQTGSKIRPVSVPATQISNFGYNEKRRPSTSNPRAAEARRKSVADIRRASQLIKSGKTKLPYSSHERKPKTSQLQQPYRSIRDGAMSDANLDSKDNDIGNDLFHQIKQGMILGELASSLHLEEQIDDFFEDLDKYKKENPTHFEPTDLKKLAADQKAAKDKKTKPKRNQLRRREIELQLQDIEARKRMAADMWENMSSCRYLRLSDDRLDTSGVNTLVIDQMKMQKSLHKVYDD